MQCFYTEGLDKKKRADIIVCCENSFNIKEKGIFFYIEVEGRVTWHMPACTERAEVMGERTEMTTAAANMFHGTWVQEQKKSLHDERSN